MKTRQPLRVTHVITGLGLGGAETVLWRVVTNTPDVQHEVISLGGRHWYSPLLEERGIPVHHLSMGHRFFRGCYELFRLIRSAKPDVVQCWMYRANLLGGLAGKAAGRPTIWNIRCSSLEPLGVKSRLLAYAGGAMAPWAAQSVVNCSVRSSELHGKIGYGRAPGIVIPNGYDVVALAPDDEARERTRHAIGVDPQTFLVGSIGRWHLQKDIPNLLAAVKMASDEGLRLKCVLLGTELDEDNAELGALIDRVGCRDIVQLLGRRSDVRDVANAMDLHVLASSGAEAFPNVVAETMACAVPNVVTDVGDAGMIVDDTGWLVEPRDPQALAGAIAEAYHESRSSPQAWSARKSAARRRIVEHFSLDRMIKAYMSIWKRYAAAPGVGRPAAE